MEGRFVDLEIRYTHLERQYAELSQAVFDHQKLIEALQRELARCNDGCTTWATPSPTKSLRTTERAGGRASALTIAVTLSARGGVPQARPQLCNAAEPPKEPRHVHPLPENRPSAWPAAGPSPLL